MNTKNEVFEYLIDQLRQQVNSNKCEDLAHGVQSLKNRLRDASAQIKELHMALVKATGDAEAYKLIRKQEQSGCRKEDTQECEHDWVLDEKGDYFICAKCGKQEAELIDCRHTNTVGLRKGFAPGFTKKCLDCGAKLK
ncbi:hypothetical protein QCF74_gp20 [Escherichia phage SZH-1]|uniref:hypothetical protein n=1 Tax=Escherichia phage SZH-1 TaxID=2945916 RepID=UPI002187AB94|nr:hypothetical protein QCF74_gp20 [Escherichia phage SZH-1]URG18156.1 hypothetical protein [Escherichia phage SZH-1]